MNKPKLMISRPKDESFEAFKKWLQDVNKGLGVSGKEPSDDEYKKVWQKFWGKK
jgi:hypothetical protein